MTGWSIALALPSEAETQRLAMDLAMAVKAGDILTLSGDLGAGKSTFARAMVRALAEDPELEVPSPTFTLLQSYDLPRFPVVHADLYRLASPDDLAELGWDEAADGALVLVEWPDRLGGPLSGERLELTFSLDPVHGRGARKVQIIGHDGWAERLKRAVALRQFLSHTDWAEAERRYLQGDASSRTYERLLFEGKTSVLMNAPKKPDGPPIRGGLPYSRIAHLAEDMVPFVALAEGLRDIGLSSPAIEAVDLDQGFLILEDLGRDGVVEGDPPAPMPERYLAAIDALVELHARPRPAQLATPKGPYTIPPYDMDAMAIEVELLIDWYLPRTGQRFPASERQTFLDLWKPLFNEVIRGPQTWVLRDYHSPNLIWLESREGIEKVGIIDFQDAMMGSPAYDVASLLQDARVTVPEALELQGLSRYAKGRKSADPAFDMAAFARSYAIMSAQRATKILGIFARLNDRDGKPGYLKHIPRLYSYLQRSLAHPALSDLKRWYDQRLPPP